MSDEEKSGSTWHVWYTEMSKPEPLLRCRKRLFRHQNRGPHNLINLQVNSECCAGGVRHIRWHESVLGSSMELREPVAWMLNALPFWASFKPSMNNTTPYRVRSMPVPCWRPVACSSLSHPDAPTPENNDPGLGQLRKSGSGLSFCITLVVYSDKRNT